jgi:uncharacterized membrane protein
MAHDVERRLERRLGFWWIFPLFMFLMMIGCAAFFLFGHRSVGGHMHRGRSWGDPTYSALEILNERFAKGEIPRQEYEEKKNAILSRGQP